MQRKREEKRWDIEEVLQMRVIDKKKEFLMKWEGYPIEESTWEPEKSLLEDCPQTVKRYLAMLRKYKQTHTHYKIYRGPYIYYQRFDVKGRPLGQFNEQKHYKHHIKHQARYKQLHQQQQQQQQQQHSSQEELSFESDTSRQQRITRSRSKRQEQYKGCQHSQSEEEQSDSLKQIQKPKKYEQIIRKYSKQKQTNQSPQKTQQFDLLKVEGVRREAKTIIFTVLCQLQDKKKTQVHKEINKEELRKLDKNFLLDFYESKLKIVGDKN